MPSKPPIHWPTSTIFSPGAVPIHVYRHGPFLTSVPPHDHQFMEIVLVGAGSIEQRSAVGVHRLKRGDVVLLRPGAWHEYTAGRGLELYDCCIGLEVLHRELAWTANDPLLSVLFWHGPLGANRPGIFSFSLQPGPLENCIVRLNALSASLQRDSTWHRSEQVGLLLLFLDALASQMPEPMRSAAEPRATAPSPIVLRAVDLLENQVALPWTLSELSKCLRVDSSYLTRLFNRFTGLPPMAFLARCRAEKAAQLLVHTTLPIGEIGAQVGWDNPRHLAERFKAHFGLSASSYRSKFRIADGKMRSRSK